MSAAQRAMAVAMIYPEPEKGGRGKKKTVDGLIFAAASLTLPRQGDIQHAIICVF